MGQSFFQSLILSPKAQAFLDQESSNPTPESWKLIWPKGKFLTLGNFFVLLPSGSTGIFCVAQVSKNIKFLMSMVRVKISCPARWQRTKKVTKPKNFYLWSNFKLQLCVNFISQNLFCCNELSFLPFLGKTYKYVFFAIHWKRIFYFTMVLAEVYTKVFV